MSAEHRPAEPVVDIEPAPRADAVPPPPPPSQPAHAARPRPLPLPAGRWSKWVAVVLYERQSGITTADETRAGADAAALAARYKAPNGAPAPPIRSADGKALMVVVSVPEEGVNDTIAEVRDRLGPGGDGLVVKVTGSAAFQYDVNKSLNAIDTTLLLVTVIVVAVILLITYRSPVLWLVPLLVVGLANQLATAVTYALAAWLDLRLNAASVFVITVLVYGAGTDYALLLISRYREELRRHADRHAAMRA